MSRKRPFRVLILCTGNSARSIVGEYLLREKGKGRFEVHSAGAKPSGKVNPFSVWVLKEHYGIDARDARSRRCHSEEHKAADSQKLGLGASEETAGFGGRRKETAALKVGANILTA